MRSARTVLLQRRERDFQSLRSDNHGDNGLSPNIPGANGGWRRTTPISFYGVLKRQICRVSSRLGPSLSLTYDGANSWKGATRHPPRPRRRGDRMSTASSRRRAQVTDVVPIGPSEADLLSLAVGYVGRRTLL